MSGGLGTPVTTWDYGAVCFECGHWGRWHRPSRPQRKPDGNVVVEWRCKHPPEDGGKSRGCRCVRTMEHFKRAEGKYWRV